MRGGAADTWLSDVAARSQVIAQATATSKQLGHDLVQWLVREDDCRSRCVRCGAAAIARPRSLGAPLGGEALTFECSKKKGTTVAPPHGRR